ncbi:hypothetical protein [Senegalia massiliensis]|uniref:Uncharacterized protein n=1 Tax=Senegalia massiliensis TaxID=1720316 RepID=A0A845R7B2_9CLOT|nr:hypothetical protein [Senegalia massiliensis]NBI08383.1 hypothetical protein [Senegalia massiliensis]
MDTTLNNLEHFIKEINKTDKYYEILSTIFETHFKLDSKEELIKNLNIHITEVFKVNAHILIEYLQHPNYFKIEQLELNASKYKASLKLINEMKMKYGLLLRPLLASQNNPFLINSIDINVGNQQTLHRLNIERADGQKLEGQFNAESLLAITSVFIDSIDKALERGIFNLNIQTINNYFEYSEILNERLNKLKVEYEKEDKNDK